MNKSCQNCKNNFTIESDDFSFYEKIKVPPPTFCPECRMVRRMIWRNVRSLYKRECGLCSKVLISMYSPELHTVYCNECWNGDSWNPISYGKDYDFSRNFFSQLKELFQAVPLLYRYGFGNLVNSDYTNFTKDNKNAYLSYSVTNCEDVMYSETIDKTKNTMDSYAIQKIDGCYYNIDCEGNYNVHYAVKSQSCVDSYFIYDCINCQNCCLSSNLRNQQYVFKNQKLTKEAYQEALKNLHLETYSGIIKSQKEFDNIIRNEAFHKFAFTYSVQNVSGDYIHNAKNIKRCFDTNDSENVAYSMRAIEVKDCYDNQGVGFKAELIYESMAATNNTYKDFFCYITLGSRECEYSLDCRNCSNCFGCVALNNKKYCIFNKQYEKEEYFSLVEKIKEHTIEIPYIDTKGRIFKYGEFFPYDMCPFGYNETNAHDFFRISEIEAIEKGYPWKEREKRDYKVTINSTDLPDNINDVDDSILNEIIACPNEGNQTYQCTTAFRITENELQFYRNKKLPIPRFCPNCRHYQRLIYRNPMHLYDRECMCNKNHSSHTGKCDVEFQTTYAPDRLEKVYCEKCYQQEIY